MNQKSKFEELTNDQLLEKKQKFMSAFIGLVIVMFVADILLFYFAFKTKNMGLTAVAIGTTMAFLPSAIALSQIKAEIKKRGI